MKKLTKKRTRLLIFLFISSFTLCTTAFVYNYLSKQHSTKVTAANKVYDDIEFDNLNSEDVIYINNYLLNLSFCIPSSWENNYVCHTTNNNVSFYYSKLYDKKTGDGLLFTLYVVDNNILSDPTNTYSDLENFKILKKNDTQSVVISYPTAKSVQNSSVSNEDFLNMLDGVTDIVSNSIKLSEV